MNSRQYEAMRLAEHAAKKSKTTVASHNKLIRHLKRKSEDELVDNYLNRWFADIKEVRAMVRDHGWTWKEAKECRHRNLNYYLDPTISVYLTSKDRAKYKRMFRKEIPFLFVRDFVEEVYWYPTLDDVVDFLEMSAILLKNPDHCGLGDIRFSKEKTKPDNGEITEFYMVTFSLDS
jgi:hypothetical protein